MADQLIHVENYSFSINNNSILNNVTLSVHEGEYISVIGPNGAGKTTLLKCLMRIYAGGTGSISISGKPIESYKQKDLAKLLSYVPQGDSRNLDFTAYEFVMMGRYPHMSPFTSLGTGDKKAVSDALEATETTHLRDRYLNTLSGGERQNVFIAAAIAQGSNILLLDEPTTFLDPKHRHDIHKTLKRVNCTQGITIVSVTHDINSASLLSSRVILLKDGSVAFTGSPAEVMCNDVLEPVYDKEFLFTDHPSTGRPVIIPGDITL
jgi:iron complex transport system ATP-binding protein